MARRFPDRSRDVIKEMIKGVTPRGVVHLAVPTLEAFKQGKRTARLLTRQEYENSNIVSSEYKHVAIRAMKHGPGGNVRGAFLEEVDFSREGTIEEDEIVLTFDGRVGSDDRAMYSVALDEHTTFTCGPLSETNMACLVNECYSHVEPNCHIRPVGTDRLCLVAATVLRPGRLLTTEYGDKCRRDYDRELSKRDRHLVEWNLTKGQKKDARKGATKKANEARAARAKNRDK